MEYKPFLISWNVTQRCNLRCAHCYIDSSELSTADPGELTTDEGIGLIDQIADFTPGAMLVFSGGEPLLREDLPELIRAASDKRLMPVLGTNGTLLNDDTAKKLRECGVKGVGISLDSLNPAKHDAFRGVQGAWEKTMKGIIACRKHGLEFQIQTTVTKKNYSEIPEIIGYASKIGAKAFNLFFLVCTGRGQEMTDISPHLYERMLRYLAKVQGQYNMMVRARCAPHFVRISQSEADKEDAAFPRAWSVGCMAGINYCRITPNGEVTPCPYLPLKLGSVRKDKFSHIWKNSKVLTGLQRLGLKGKCGRCRYSSSCRGCRARAFAIQGDYLAEDPWCLYTPGRNNTTSGEMDEVTWSEEAKKRMSKAPAFLRGMIAKRVEAYAKAHGIKEITPELLAEMRNKWEKRRK